MSFKVQQMQDLVTEVEERRGEPERPDGVIDLSLDIETLGTKENSVITAIALCAFTVDGGVIEGSKLELYPHIQRQLDMGRKVDADTLYFWFDEMAKKGHNPHRHPTGDPYSMGACFDILLDQIAHWSSWDNFGTDEAKMTSRIWVRGMDFDLPMLRSASKEFAQDRFRDLLPFWCFRDQRTLVAAHKDMLPKREGTAHNALDDAVYQAECLIAVSKLTGIPLA